MTDLKSNFFGEIVDTVSKDGILATPLQLKLQPPFLVANYGDGIRVYNLVENTKSIIQHFKCNIKLVCNNNIWCIDDQGGISVINLNNQQQPFRVCLKNDNGKITKDIFTAEDKIIFKCGDQYFASDLDAVDISKDKIDISVSETSAFNVQKARNLNKFISATSIRLDNGQDGTLKATCIETKLSWDIKLRNPIKDFTTFTDSCLILLQEVGDNGCSIILRDIFQPQEDIVCLPVDQNCQLINGFGNMFLYLIENDLAISVYKVERRNPSNLMEALATQGQFQEATEFALNNNLDIETVYKMKFQQMASDIVSGQDIPLDLMMDLMPLIKDIYFLRDNCVMISKIDEKYWLLLNKLKTMSNEKKYISSLEEVIFKLNLIKYLDKIDCLKDLDVHIKTLPELCHYFLTREELELASFVWLKNSQLCEFIGLVEATNILYATPHNVQLNTLTLWLKNFFPSILKCQPFFIDTAVKWVSERTAQLEKSKYWPEDGIAFLKDAIQILDNIPLPIVVSFASVENLRILSSNLLHIQELKRKYRVNILLAELSISNPADVVTLVLRRSYTEDIPDIVNGWISLFIARTDINRESVILEYLEREALQGSIDDTRIVALLNCMSDMETRHSALNNILAELAVPWNQAILKEALFAVECNHKYSRLIKVQIEYSKLKLLANKFNFPPDSYHSHSSILKIVYSDIATSDDDIQTLITIYPKKCGQIILLYIQKCLQNDKFDAALDFINTFNKQQKSVLAQQLAAHFESLLEDSTENCSLERNYLDFLKVTKFLDKTSLKYLENVYLLKKGFNINIRCTNEEENLLKILEDWCEKSTKSNIFEFYQKSMLLGNLLNIKKDEVIAVIVKYIDQSNILNVIDLIAKDNFPIFKFIRLPIVDLFEDGKNYDLLMKCTNSCLDNVVGAQSAEELAHPLHTLSIFNDLRNYSPNIIKVSNSVKFHGVYMPKRNKNSVNVLLTSLLSDDEALRRKTFESIENGDIVCVKLLTMVHSRLLRNSLDVEDCNKLIEIMAKKFTQNMLLSQNCDDLLITTLMCLMERPEIWIRDFITTHVKDESHSNMAIIKFMTNNIFHCHEPYSDPLMRFIQNNDLKLDNLTLSESPNDTADAFNVLITILRVNDMKYDCLRDLCELINVQMDDALIVQLLVLLSSQGSNEKEYLFESDVDKLYNKCFTICECLDDKKLMVETLKNLWLSGELVFNDQNIFLNPYQYENYICIYRLLEYYSSDWKSMRLSLLLHYLKHYERRSEPKQQEVQQFLIAGSGPEISSRRLPFDMFSSNEMWSELKIEVTLETYHLWLPVAGLLGLDSDVQTAKDMLCSNAVKQSMTAQRQINNSLKSKWHLHQTNQLLLRNAHEAVTFISNMEWAAACLFYVLQGCRRGADQLAAAQLCFEFACCWAEVQPANNVVRKMKAEYAFMSTLHALNILGLTDKKYMRKLSDPNGLITDLYLDEFRVLSLMQNQATRIIDEIAESNCVNISSIRMQILEGILCRKNENGVGLEVNDLGRLMCVLKSTCPTIGAMYLSRIAFGEESDHFNGRRLKAMQCLISLADNELLAKVIDSDLGQLWKDAIEMRFILLLEINDLSYLVPLFAENKTKFVDVFWQSCDQNTPILSVIVNVCLVYDVEIPFMDDLVATLLSLAMFDDLLQLLLHKYHLIKEHIALDAWRTIIFAAFEKLEYPITESQFKSCISVLNLLPLCPYRDRIDLISLWKMCNEAKCSELGCLLLTIMNENQLSALNFLQTLDINGALKKMKSISSETVLSNLSAKLLYCMKRHNSERAGKKN